MDYLIKSLKKDSNIRVMLCDITKSVRKITNAHNGSIKSKQTLSSLLVYSLLMSSDLKGKQKITIILNTASNTFIAESNSKRKIRGLVSNPDSLDDIDEKSFLTVIKDYGLKQTFSSKVQLISSNITENINYFLQKSEQIPSFISGEVNFDENGDIVSSVGILLSVFPNHKKEDVEELNYLAKNISSLDNKIEILQKEEVQYKCNCSKLKFKKGLSALPIRDLKEIVSIDKKCDCICNFCLKSYRFEEEELNQIINNIQHK